MTTQIKGWCPSLEKPMESGDGLLVRIPIKFGRTQADIARKIAEFSIKYGNGHLDLSNRGNLQLRGVKSETYEPLKAELAKLGFERDAKFSIIANPFDKNAQELAEKLSERCVAEQVIFPEKFLIVIDGGRVFPLFSLPCDLYITAEQADIDKILVVLKESKKCDKKPASLFPFKAPVGIIPVTDEYVIVSCALAFGRIEEEELIKLVDISEIFSNGEIIFAPFRRIILPWVAAEKSGFAIQGLEKAGFIVKPDDSYLNIHACVGAPSCSSALGDTRKLAQKWVEDHPDNTKIVHITGCAKGCAYHGKADITITVKEDGYDVS